MSLEDVDVQAKKDPAAVVHWNEYEALRDTLQRKIATEIDPINEDLQNLSVQVDGLATTAEETQVQVTTIQTSIDALTQQFAELRTLFQQHRAADDDHSVNGEDEHAADGQGDNQEQLGRGGGRGDRGRGGRAGAGLGRGFAPIGARRHLDFPAAPQNREDDGLGKPKFSIPQFTGSPDVEEYLIWELKIEKLWRLHDYTEDRKIKLASSEFDGYALRWWDHLVRTREEDGELPIVTWSTMKGVMRDRFVPRNYIRSLYDKLQQLRQGVPRR